ncbi:MAG TPA: 4Fe-4S binding protein [bacterium]|nr:4Fe-4S binding protein [bacterium]
MKKAISVSPGTSKNNKTGAWRTFRPEIDFEKCTGCGICESVCPEPCISNSHKKNKMGKEVRQIDYDYCKGCGLCAAECPFKAISMKVEKK